MPSAAGLPAAPSSGTGTAAPHTERNLPPPSPRSPLIPAVTTGPSSQQVGNSRKSQGREAWGLVPTCLGPSRTQKGLHDAAGTRNDPMAAQLGTGQQVLSQLKPTREHPGQQEKLWAAPAPHQQSPPAILLRAGPAPGSCGSGRAPCGQNGSSSTALLCSRNKSLLPHDEENHRPIL